MNRPLSDISPEAFATPLLAWYDRTGVICHGARDGLNWQTLIMYFYQN